MNFHPKCRYGRQCPAVTAKGWLVPCCLIDCMKDGAEHFFTDELKIENNNNLYDIFASPEWVELDELIDEGDVSKLPKACGYFCGGDHASERVFSSKRS